MRHFFTLFLAFVAAVSAQAQHIPDANFAAAIRQQCPSCIDANNDLLPAAATLTSLNVSSRQISDLTGIGGFISLQYLYCGSNYLTVLPTLTNNLRHLDCSSNQLTSLPSLPTSLRYLNCSYNQLTILPILPPNLTELFCISNQLTNLPALPTIAFTRLYCANNQLTQLPALPNSLSSLSANNNAIHVLPSLPYAISFLSCDNCSLDSLPHLPEFLVALYCSDNNLNQLLVPPHLSTLQCNNNPLLSCLSILPNNLRSLMCGGTNITCLPNLPPNLQNNTLPICNPSNNPNGCITLNQAQGQVYFDLNATGVFDNGDINVSNQLLTTNSLFAAATDSNGFYSLALDTNTTNTISLPTFYNTNYFTVSPASYTIVTDTTIQTYPNNDFVITPLGNFDDVEVGVLGGLYRPGFDNVFYINYKNVGTTTISGSLSLDLDTDVSFLSASEPSTQAGQNLSFNFSNLAPFETRTIEILVNVDTSVSLGTAINHTLNGIITNDADITNNQYVSNDIVVGSYDPNDINANKEEICSNYPTELEEDLVYTIRFQNTGTFYAQNVRVEDTLSALLDISSFQQIAASHNYRLVFDNVFINGERKILAKWYFDNIMLLDSFTNEPLSHGYIKYKIKPLAAQLANRNEIIASQAHIYFDFNAAINTNIDEVISNICMGINENAADNSSQSFQILPNPNKGNFNLRFAENVDLENANLYIYNYLGELITQQKLQNNNPNIATNDLPAVAYIVKVQAKNATFVQKMIIE